MNRGLKHKILTSVTGLALLAGCSGLSGGMEYDRREIRYSPYVEAIFEEASILSKSEDAYKLKDSGGMFLDIGKLKEAEEIAKRLLKLNRNFGMDLYKSLQDYRNDHPENKD